jgi:hypothetical protein
MGSGAVIYILNVIKIDSGIQKLIEGDLQTHTQTAWRSHKPVFHFFTMRKVGCGAMIAQLV